MADVCHGVGQGVDEPRVGIYRFARSVDAGTPGTCLAASTSRSAPSESADERVVTQIFTSWNRIADWLRQTDRFQQAAQARDSTPSEPLRRLRKMDVRPRARRLSVDQAAK